MTTQAEHPKGSTKGNEIPPENDTEELWEDEQNADKEYVIYKEDDINTTVIIWSEEDKASINNVMSFKEEIEDMGSAMVEEEKDKEKYKNENEKENEKGEKHKDEENEGDEEQHKEKSGDKEEKSRLRPR